MRILTGSLLSVALGSNFALARNSDETEFLIQKFNMEASQSDEIPEILSWESTRSDSDYLGAEILDVLLVELSDGAICKAIAWSDNPYRTTSFLGDAPPDQEPWFNEEYKKLTVHCASGKKYKMIKKVSPKDLFDRLNPGPNQGEETYVIEAGKTTVS